MHQTMVLGKDGIDDLSLGRSGVAAMAAWLSSQYGDSSSNPKGQVYFHLCVAFLLLFLNYPYRRQAKTSHVARINTWDILRLFSTSNPCQCCVFSVTGKEGCYSCYRLLWGSLWLSKVAFCKALHLWEYGSHGGTCSHLPFPCRFTERRGSSCCWSVPLSFKRSDVAFSGLRLSTVYWILLVTLPFFVSGDRVRWCTKVALGWACVWWSMVNPFLSAGIRFLLSDRGLRKGFLKRVQYGDRSRTFHV